MAMGSDLDRALLQRLPLPLAQLYRRAHNAKSPLERHLTAFYFWEAGLKLLASVAIVEYARRPQPDPRLAERLHLQVDALAGRRLIYVSEVRQVGGQWLIQRLELAGEGARRIPSIELSRSAASALPDAERLWDVASGAELVALQGHADGVTHVAFSPDGRRLASASLDATVKLWISEATAEEAESRRLAWLESEAALCQETGRWHGAALHLSVLIERRPSDATLYQRRAAARRHLERWDDALSDLAKAIVLDLAMICHDLGMSEAAQDHLKIAIAKSEPPSATDWQANVRNQLLRREAETRLQASDQSTAAPSRP
jgi:tetratricopeptide (TPR) repeat protein